MRKHATLCLFLSCLQITLGAQEADITPCTIYNALFSVDLRLAIATLKLDSLTGPDAIPYGIVPAPSTYRDAIYSDNRCDDKDTITYCESNSEKLIYTVYYPDSVTNKKIKYTNIACGLPAVVMFHGGSFEECSSLSSEGIRTVCIELALRGFVVFNVEYRRGVLVDRREVVPTIKNEYYAAQQMLAIYRACQNARGAIRSIILRQRNSASFQDPFRIDTTRMFVGGISAGSFISLNTAYYPNQDMINAIFPGVAANLGDIEQNTFYYADTTVEYYPNLKGVLNMWGSLQVPLSYTNNQGGFFSQNGITPKPQITFHGRLDSVFFADSVFIFFSPNNISQGINFSKESNCMAYGTQYQFPANNPATRDLLGLGGLNIYKFLKNLGVPAQLHIDCEAEHGLDDDSVNVGDPPYESNYGAASAVTRASTQSYIAGQAAVFFLAILKGEATSISGTTRFIECENFRHGCGATNLDDDDAGCDDTDDCP